MRANGGPAFPTVFRNTGDQNIFAPDGDVVAPGREVILPGMTLLDYFAAKALHAEMMTTASDATPAAMEAFLGGAARAGHTVEEHFAFNALQGRGRDDRRAEP